MQRLAKDRAHEVGYGPSQAKDCPRLHNQQKHKPHFACCE